MGELTGRERRAGGKASWDGLPTAATIGLYIKKVRCRVTAIYKRWHSLKSECVELPNKNVSSGATTGIAIVRAAARV